MIIKPHLRLFVEKSYFYRPGVSIFALMNFRNWIIVLCGVITMVAATRCASEVAPTGGPQDKNPPVLLSAEPPTGTVNFDRKLIKVNFDEFLQLKDVNEKMIVSPPMTKKPEVLLKGKSVLIKIQDTLRSETTYNLFLGDAIADLNEGNAVPSFRYVFSTGTYIDSLSVRGSVVDAQTRAPLEGIWVVLYPAGSDTAFFTFTPYYIATTDKTGAFYLDQLQNGEYQCYALEDINANFYFDLPDERIAFCDQPITPGYAPALPDSLPDSVRVSTVPQLMLALYREPDTVVKLSGSHLIDNYVVEFLFNQPTPSARFTTADSVPLPKSIRRVNATADTVRWWIRDTTVKVMNVVVLNDTIALDTVRITLTSKDFDQKGMSTYFKNNLVSHTRLLPGSTFNFYSENPLAAFDFSRSLLKTATDSLTPVFETGDTLNTVLFMKNRLEEGATYSLLVASGAMTDIYGNTNDSLVIPFTLINPDELGNLEISLTLPGENPCFILYLLDAKEKMVKSMPVAASGKYIFSNLFAGKYTLSAIDDRDRNGKWSPGRIFLHQQPEKVFSFEKPIDIRSKWKVQEVWTIE